MSEIKALTEAEESFLRTYLPSPHGHSSARPLAKASASLPFVTLTYACSLDGMISLGPGMRTTLSGPETKSMTHYLRMQHDAILVGVGTAMADKPSLNCRYPGASLEHQPRPVIVDPTGRWTPEGTPVAKLASEGKGHTPWVFSLPLEDGVQDSLPKLGGKRLVPDLKGTKPEFLWRAIFETLKAEGIDSVMVEGGAKVINALLAEPDIVDAVIVTIAPTWLGQGGVAACPAMVMSGGERVNAARLTSTSWRQFGADAVLCGRLGE